MTQQTTTKGNVVPMRGFGQTSEGAPLATTQQSEQTPAQALAARISSTPARTIVSEAGILTLKNLTAGLVVGAAVSSSGRRAAGAVDGAVITATAGPVVFGLFEAARLYLSDIPPEVRREQIRLLAKTTGVAAAAGGVLWGLKALLTRKKTGNGNGTGKSGKD